MLRHFWEKIFVEIFFVDCSKVDAQEKLEKMQIQISHFLISSDNETSAIFFILLNLRSFYILSN